MSVTTKRSELVLARRVKLLNQFDVAKLLGISQAKYSLIENGYKSPTPQEAQKLIAMFGLLYLNATSDGLTATIKQLWRPKIEDKRE